MLLTIAYSHKDIEQADRLVRWIGFLASAPGAERPPRCLLVASRMASRTRLHPWVAYRALKVFGAVYVHVPHDELEKGWPKSANFMFARALFHVEQCFKDDMLWVEPDCVPVSSDWYGKIRSEWEGPAAAAGKTFMGARIRHAMPHMSGNGVYGRKWRDVIPELGTPLSHSAWDAYYGKKILETAHITNLIQQVWRPKSKKQLARLLSRNAVLFHQDKYGMMIQDLNENRFGRGFNIREPQEGVETLTMPTKFYHADNATIRRQVGGFQFRFDPYCIVAGTPMGVLEVTDEVEQLAMQELAEDPTTGITEISAADYEERSKKKPKPREQTPLRGLSSPPAVAIPASPEPVVEKADIPKPKVDPKDLPDVDSAVQLGDVSEVAPVKAPTAKKKGRRPKVKPVAHAELQVNEE
jgi:hypothetical protein